MTQLQDWCGHIRNQIKQMAATRSCARAVMTGLTKQWAKHTAQMLWCCSAKKYEDSKLFQRCGTVVQHHSLQRIHFCGCFPGKSGFAGFRPWFFPSFDSNEKLRGHRFLQAGCPFLIQPTVSKHWPQPGKSHILSWSTAGLLRKESCFLYASSPTDWLVVLRPTRHEIGHFRDVFQANFVPWSSQSLGLVWKNKT